MTAYLVGVLEGPSVNAVVRGIELALWEPGNVTLLEAAVLNSLERDIPVNGLATELKVRKGISQVRRAICDWPYTALHSPCPRILRIRTSRQKATEPVDRSQ